MEYFEVSCLGEEKALGERGRAVRSVKEAVKVMKGNGNLEGIRLNEAQKSKLTHNVAIIIIIFLINLPVFHSHITI